MNAPGNGPEADEYAVRYLVRCTQLCRNLLADVEERKQGGMSEVDYAYAHGQLTSMLAGLVDAVTEVHPEARP